MNVFEHHCVEWCMCSYGSTPEGCFHIHCSKCACFYMLIMAPHRSLFCLVCFSQQQIYSDFHVTENRPELTAKTYEWEQAKKKIKNQLIVDD